MAAGLLLAACAPAPTALAPTPVPTAVPPTASPAPTAVPPTAAPTEFVPVLATSASLDQLTSVALDAEGNLYFSTCRQIFAIDSAGMMTLIAGAGIWGFAGDGGPALDAASTCIVAIAFDSTGRVWAIDRPNNRIRRFELGGIIDSVVGSGGTIRFDTNDITQINGAFAGDGGPANEAQLYAPSAMAFDPQGNLYILDSENYRVRQVDPAGIITTIAGVGTFGYLGDGGLALEAQMRGGSRGIAVDAAGNVYIADTRNAVIRRIDADGIITTIAGTGEHGFSGDGGPATEAQLSNPAALVVDAQGRLYFADDPSGDFNESHIRMIDAEGIITTLVTNHYAGVAPQTGVVGESALGTGGLAVDAQGNVYYADTRNGLIKKVTPDGTVTIVAGGGS